MENVDTIDRMTAIYGGWIELIPPYMGNRRSGRTLRFNRTEEVRGSNPLRSMEKNPVIGVFYVKCSLLLDAGIICSSAFR
jgi:hypothetical protein